MALSDKLEPDALFLLMGWKRLVERPPRFRMTAVGVPACTEEAAGFIPGNIILMREGEGDGAREDTALVTLEALISQF